jgi:DNA repair protein RecO (recombination protein O)
MLQKTKGIVIRTVKYGETSLVVTVFTEAFGLQSYMVNGVRKAVSRAGFHPGQFQPACLLDLVVYRQEHKNLQRIRECRWAKLYEHIFNDIAKNAVALFMVELLQKCLRQPEPHPELFYFVEDSFSELDQSAPPVTANLPAFFALHLSHFFGFRMEDGYDKAHTILDLREGEFVSQAPVHPEWIEDPLSGYISRYLKAQLPSDLSEINIPRSSRREVLETCLHFYAIHTPEFSRLRSLPVLQAVLGD